MNPRKMVATLVLASAGLVLSQSVFADDCKNCGKVKSINSVKVKGQGSGGGAIAGGIVGGALGNQFGSGSGRTAMTVLGAAGGAYAGNEIEKNAKSKMVYKVAVSMDYGEVRNFTLYSQPGFAVGDRVRVVDGKPVFYSH